MTKIAIIGPVFPYRGGIAHHTGNLANHLRKLNVDVEVFTFSRQYPRFLYPGKSQIETGRDLFPELKKTFLIDTLNPFTWWKTYKKIFRNDFGFCVFKYWHFYFAPCFIFIAFFLKKKGIKIVCIVDNIFSHETNFLDKKLSTLFLRLCDVSITQSVVVDDEFRSIFPTKKHYLIRHPVYDNFGLVKNALQARNLLSLPPNKKILLFFGFIRPYKGLDILLNVFPQLLKSMPNLHLVIAGECFGSFSVYQKIIDDLKMNDNITLNIGYIDNSFIPDYFSAADVFIMPYRSATNSGVLEIAKNYNLPVLTSNIKAFTSLQNELGIFCADLSSAEDIIKGLKYLLNLKNTRFITKNSWEQYSVEFIKKICSL